MPHRLCPVRPAAIDTRPKILHDQSRSMRRISQFVALLLALLLLAPAASAELVCKAQAQHEACSKSCCAEMDAGMMSMGGDALMAQNLAQLSATPCCEAAVRDALPLAAPSSASGTEAAPLAPTAVAALAALPTQPPVDREFPPGQAFRGPTPARLCAFLI